MKRTHRRRGLMASILGLTLLLAGCSSMDINDFRGTAPELDIHDYFQGELRAWGIVENRSGVATRQFTVDMVGRLEGDTLVLEEDFEYADGETDRRVWRIRKEGEHKYVGTAGDVIGEARGEARGRAFHWEYKVDLKVGDSTYRVAFDDWMYRQEDDVVINRATITKWGFEVAQVTVVFQKKGAE